MKISRQKVKEVGNKLKVNWGKIHKAEFYKGMHVELEHGSRDKQTDVTHDNLITTGKIALAHLKESSRYYTHLENMEKKMAKAKKEGANMAKKKKKKK